MSDLLTMAKVHVKNTFVSLLAIPLSSDPIPSSNLRASYVLLSSKKGQSDGSSSENDSYGQRF